MGVLRDHQLAELRFECGEFDRDLVDFVDEHLAFVPRRTVEHLTRRLAVPASTVVAADLRHHRAEIVVPLRDGAQLIRVGEYLRVGELVFERLVLVDDLCETVRHRHVTHRPARPDGSRSAARSRVAATRSRAGTTISSRATSSGRVSATSATNGMRSRSTPDEKTTATRVPASSTPRRNTRLGVLHALAGHRRIDRMEFGEPEDARVLLHLPAQESFRCHAIERMLDRLGTAMGRHSRHHLGERCDLGQVSVDDLECLPIVRPDTDLEDHAVAPCGKHVGGHVVEFGEVADGRLVDRPAHLEPAHVAGDDAALDEWVGAPRLDQRHEVEVLGGSLGDRGRRLCDDGKQGAFLCEPHTDREREAGRPSGNLATFALDDDIERRRPLANGPDQAGAERATGRAVDDHPGGIVHDQPGTGAELDRFGVDCRAEMLGHEHAQLDPQQLPPPLAGRGHRSVSHRPRRYRRALTVR